MRKIRLLMVLFVLSLSAGNAFAQKSSVGLNVGDLACLGTFNAHYDYAFSQKWSLGGSMRYNPWTLHSGDTERQSQLRHQSYAVNAKFWPWYVYSGMWFGVKAQYQEYNRGGFGGRIETEEGDAIGIGAEIGYCLLLNHKWNVGFGIGGWGGYTVYTKYGCSYCGRVTERGEKLFLYPNELILSLSYIL